MEIFRQTIENDLARKAESATSVSGHFDRGTSSFRLYDSDNENRKMTSLSPTYSSISLFMKDEGQ